LKSRANQSPEQQFQEELEIFRKEAESAAQFFYAYLAIHETAKRNRSVFDYLNANALLWNTIAGSLQTSALIALHRIFNHRSRHRLDSLLKVAEENVEIFSKEALRQRKRGNHKKDPDWLDEYMERVYEPTKEDLIRIRSQAEEYKRLYEANYAGLRNKVYAHMIVSDPEETQLLVSKTDIREMERMVVYLLSMYAALQNLYDNGRKPVRWVRKYSIERILKSTSKGSAGDVHVRIAKEVQQVLREGARAVSG